MKIVSLENMKPSFWIFGRKDAKANSLCGYLQFEPEYGRQS